MTKKKRTYNPNLVKQTLSYSTQEIAALFGIHRRTVESWYAAGLPRIDNRKPFLVLGGDLKDFLRAKQKSKKVRCQINELYCFKCRTPRRSWEDQIDIKYLTETRIMLIGLCPQCNIILNKVASAKKIPELQKIFMIQKVHEKDLVGSNPPIYNTDINKVIKP
jgi:transposase